MQRTISMKLLPTKTQKFYLKKITCEYIKTINAIVDRFVKAKNRPKLSSKNVDAMLPSAVKNQAIRDARTIFTRVKKLGRKCIARKPVCIWNNQNYKIQTNASGKHAWISFPVYVEKKVVRITVRTLMSEYQRKLLAGSHGTLRIVEKNGKWMAQVAVDVPRKFCVGSNIMGVDIGLKNPAVGYVEGGKARFFGNGRKNKFVRRQNKTRRRRLGMAKKLEAIKKNNNKDHQLCS